MRKLQLTLSLIIIGLFLSCGGNTERPKSAEQLKIELQVQENDTPLKFLSLENLNMNTQSKKTKNGGLFRKAEFAQDGVLLTGSIKNEATVADYKDISIKVTYLSKTESVIDEAYYTLYEYYKHGTTTSFRVKTASDDTPNSFESFNVTIEGAKVVY